MMPDNSNQSERQNEFVKNLVAFAQQHRAKPWSGMFGEFLEKIVPGDTRGIARNSHQYISLLSGKPRGRIAESHE